MPYPGHGVQDEAAPVKFLYDPDGQGWQGPPSGPKKPATQVQLAGSMLLAGARHATQCQWPVMPTYCRRHLGIQSGRHGEEEKQDRGHAQAGRTYQGIWNWVDSVCRKLYTQEST